jgi:hypothetical protein
MAKRKMRKFADGGFTAEQEKWLGGADRTDPYILARMRSAHPDAPAPSESTIEDESGRGNISPNAAAFNKDIPGAGPSTPVTKTVSQTQVSITKPKSKIDPDWDNNNKMLPGHKKSKIDPNWDNNKIMLPGHENIDPDWDNVYKMLPGHKKSDVKLKLKSGGAVKKMSSGGSVSSASKRADGIATKGKTRGKIC